MFGDIRTSELYLLRIPTCKHREDPFSLELSLDDPEKVVSDERRLSTYILLTQQEQVTPY